MGATSNVADDRAAVDDLGLGREAYTRRAWGAARDHLTRAEPATLMKIGTLTSAALRARKSL